MARPFSIKRCRRTASIDFVRKKIVTVIPGPRRGLLFGRQIRREFCSQFVAASGANARVSALSASRRLAASNLANDQ
jgi:hypothetical protein